MDRRSATSALGRKATADARAQFGEGDLGAAERNAYANDESGGTARGWSIKRGKDGKLKGGYETVNPGTKVIGSDTLTDTTDNRVSDENFSQAA